MFYGQLEDVCLNAGFHRESNIAHYVPSFELLKSMVRSGKGIAFIPASLDLKQEPDLVSMPITNTDRWNTIQRDCDQARSDPQIRTAITFGTGIERIIKIAEPSEF